MVTTTCLAQQLLPDVYKQSASSDRQQAAAALTTLPHIKCHQTGGGATGQHETARAPSYSIYRVPNIGSRTQGAAGERRSAR